MQAGAKPMLLLSPVGQKGGKPLFENVRNLIFFADHQLLKPCDS